MSHNRFTSAENDYESNFTDAKLQDREVDELYQMFQEKLKFLENYADATDEMRENCREAARESLFSEIGRLSDPDRAMERIRGLLENQKAPVLTQTQVSVGESQVFGSSVELVETHSSHSASSPDHSESSTDIEIINLEESDLHPESKQLNEPEAIFSQGLVPLFDITEEGETVFHRENLDSLCVQIGERPVAIISTAGKFRQGKTFWSNVLLDGLRKDQAGYKDDEHIGGHGGIRFQSGYERHTRGIMVWPKVFDRKDKEGKDIAVILIDTQGTFDTCSDIADSAVIFAISLLMSSIKIDAQDLDALNVFISFSQKTDEKVGQHFILMMRDALETGLQPEYISYLRSGTRRAPELLRLMDGVFDAFESVECYMVPRPSEHVLRASGEIRAGDCGSDFLMGLCGAANHVLNNLVAKKVMGTPLTGSTLKQYVENLVEHIRDNHHKAIGSAFAATSQLYFEKARSASNETFAKLYEQLVRLHNHRPIKPSEYNEAIQHIVQETFKEYQTHPLFGSTELKAKEFENFQRSLLDRCDEKEENNRQRYRDVQMADAVNGSYEIYEKEMKPDFLETLLGNREKKDQLRQ
ncbi:unnamed protein product, partial [Mesorhabditis belari]|uniref:GB1/RHD3-type G domain-containing protein n=1 Tax=Mesorhabditis belari TaxID=2138241 RepID=A0AAF3EZY7_9BILA